MVGQSTSRPADMIGPDPAIEQPLTRAQLGKAVVRRGRPPKANRKQITTLRSPRISWNISVNQVRAGRRGSTRHCAARSSDRRDEAQDSLQAEDRGSAPAILEYFPSRSVPEVSVCPARRLSTAPATSERIWWCWRSRRGPSACSIARRPCRHWPASCRWCAGGSADAPAR